MPLSHPNSFLTFFSISYCLMLIPSQVIITYVRPSYWLPGLEIGWGFVTALIAFAQNAHEVYALRVLLGLFESSAWPGMMTLFSQFQFPCGLPFSFSFSLLPHLPLSDSISAMCCYLHKVVVLTATCGLVYARYECNHE
jgi:MFS family permease